MIKKLFDRVYVIGGHWAVFLDFGLFLFNYGAYPQLKALSNGMDLPDSEYRKPPRPGQESFGAVHAFDPK